MRVNLFKIAVFIFLIIRPIIKGLSESKKAKEKWSKKHSSQSPKPLFQSVKENIKHKYPVSEEQILPLKLDQVVSKTSGDKTTKIELMQKDKFDPPQKKSMEVQDSLSLDIFDEKNLLQGIILKEILGPPKALQ